MIKRIRLKRLFQLRKTISNRDHPNPKTGPKRIRDQRSQKGDASKKEIILHKQRRQNQSQGKQTTNQNKAKINQRLGNHMTKQNDTKKADNSSQGFKGSKGPQQGNRQRQNNFGGNQNRNKFNKRGKKANVNKHLTSRLSHHVNLESYPKC